MAQQNIIISGSAMGVIVGLILTILPWVFKIPPNFLSRLFLSIFGVGVLYFSIKNSVG